MTAIQLLNTIILYHKGIIVSISYLTECIEFLLLHFIQLSLKYLQIGLHGHRHNLYWNTQKV